MKHSSDSLSVFSRGSGDTFEPRVQAAIGVRRCLTAVCLVIVGSLQISAQVRQAPGQVNQTSEMHALLRNDQLRTWQNAAYRLLKEDRIEPALFQIQKIFDSQEDGFERRLDGQGFS